MPDKLDQIVESSHPEQMGTGFAFTEGPVWHRDGYWLFVDLRYDDAADATAGNEPLFANMHSKEDGVPDGMKVDVEGRVYCPGPEGLRC